MVPAPYGSADSTSSYSVIPFKLPAHVPGRRQKAARRLGSLPPSWDVGGQLNRSIGKQLSKERTLGILASVEPELVAILPERFQEKLI